MSDPLDRTTTEVVEDLQDLLAVHGDKISGIIVCIKYDNHLPKGALDEDCHTYLSSGLTLLEAMGTLEYAKLKAYQDLLEDESGDED